MDRTDLTLQRADGTPAVVVMLVTEDWYFLSHRLAIARAARDAGARVVIATRVNAHRDAIERENFELVELPWRRSSRDPIAETRAWNAIRALYARVRPDIVHHVAIKPVVYGGVAARFARNPTQLNAIAGLGYIETSRQPRARLLRPLFNRVLRFAWKPDNVHAIVQNPDDAEVTSRFLPGRRVHLIRGSGVDLDRFVATPEPSDEREIVATFVGRILWSKGVGEIVEAARLLRERGARVTLRLVGAPDKENPESVSEATVRGWMAAGLVQWDPWTEDVVGVWRSSHMAILPSYREGLPKALLEAAASARAIIATDVPGCREIARRDVNALLVPPRDARALADAIERLARDADLRKRFGAAGRAIAEREFAETLVVEKTLALYRDLVHGAGA